jgi:hypothetical protein
MHRVNAALPTPAQALLEELPSRGQSEWVFPGAGQSRHIEDTGKA